MLQQAGAAAVAMKAADEQALQAQTRVTDVGAPPPPADVRQLDMIADVRTRHAAEISSVRQEAAKEREVLLERLRQSEVT